MAQCSADFETGTNTNTIATSDTGSTTAWDTISIGGGAAAIYDTAHPAHGTLSAKITAPNNSAAVYLGWDTALGTQSGTWYTRFYYYCTTTIGSQTDDLMTGCITSYTIGNQSFHMSIFQGQVYMRDLADTNLPSNITLTASTLYRIETKIVQSATVGQLEFKIFAGNSTSALDTVTSAASLNTRVSTDRIAFGQVRNQAPGLTWWLDDVVAGATSYPGPYVASAALPNDAASSQGSFILLLSH